MTREDFIKELEYADDVWEPSKFSVHAQRIAAHDDEQRQMIDEQVEENRGLRSDVKLVQQANAEQRQQIEDLQKRVEELLDRRNNFHRDVVEWRGVEFENVCTECSGSGYKVYGNTATYHHGAGGQAITTSVCNKCWGSGDRYKPWVSWLKIEQQSQEIARLREALQLLYSVQNGCPLPSYEKDWNRAMELAQRVKEVKCGT